MDLYIANLTKQNVEFIYRVLEGQHLRTHRIPVGTQVKLAGDFSTPDIDYIVKQHEKYGMKQLGELDRSKDFVGLTYSIGKPVPSNKMAPAMKRNVDILVERGKDIRRDAAIAESLRLEEAFQTQGRLVEFDQSIVEENYDERNASPPIAEGVRVMMDEQKNPAPRRSRRSE